MNSFERRLRIPPPPFKQQLVWNDAAYGLKGGGVSCFKNLAEMSNDNVTLVIQP
jgi:hypothetical protein